MASTIERIVSAHRRLLRARAERDAMIARAVNEEGMSGEEVARRIVFAAGPELGISGQHARMIARAAKGERRPGGRGGA